MEAGALGIGSSLIYAPAFYATTEELIELCKVAAQYRGKYISHMRSEGNRLLEAVDELIRISREAKIPAEIYHLKAAGQANWPKMDQVDREGRSGAARGPEDHRRHVHLHGRRDRARRGDAAVGPRRRLRGGLQAAARIRTMRAEDRGRDPHAGGRTGRTSTSPPARPTACCSSEFKNEKLKPLTGKTLAEVGEAARRGSGRHDHEPRARGPVARRHGLLHDVRGEHPQADRAAVGVVRLRRRVDGAGGAVHEVVDAPARLRQLRAAARQVRARREGDPARGGDPPADRPARDEPRARSPRRSP